jgi:hypothetical protein
MWLHIGLAGDIVGKEISAAGKPDFDEREPI